MSYITEIYFKELPSSLPLAISMRLPYLDFPIVVQTVNRKSYCEKILEINDWLLDTIPSSQWTTVPHREEFSNYLPIDYVLVDNENSDSILRYRFSWLYDVNYYLFKSVEDFLLFKLTWM